MQWRMLARRCPSGSMTLVGDPGQASRPGALASWSDVLAHAPQHDAGPVRHAHDQLPHAGRGHGRRVPPARGRRPDRRAVTFGAQHRRGAAVRRDVTAIDSSPRPPTQARAALARTGTLAVIAPAALHAEIIAGLGDVDAVDRRDRGARRGGRGARARGGEGPRVRPRRGRRARPTRHRRSRRAAIALRDASRARPRPSPSCTPSRSPKAWRKPAERELRRSARVAGNDVDEIAAAPGAELHDAVRLREQRVVAADADVESRVPLRAALAHDDRARGNGLAAVALHAETLRVGVTTVTRRTPRPSSSTWLSS